MAKKTAPPVADWSVPKFTGKTFAFAGKFDSWLRERLAEGVAAEGGRVVGEGKAGVDFLFATPTPSGRLSPAAKKIIAALHEQGAAPEVLTPADFGKRIVPTREQVVAMLTSGDPRAVEYWNSLPKRLAWGRLGKVDLTGCDLRGAALAGANFEYFALIDNADLRGADLAGAKFYGITGVRFDKANLARAKLWSCRACSYRGADLSGARLQGKDFTGSNFEGAKLRAVSEFELDAGGVPFVRADLTGAALPRCRFVRADFSRADLTDAVLSGCDLTGAKLTRARLRGADLSGATLVDADLSGAELRDSCLVGADLSGANVAAARLGGADVTGAKLGGTDLAAAKDADGARNGLGARTRELERAAHQGRRFTSSAIFDLADSFLEASVQSQGTGKAVEAVSRWRGGKDQVVYRNLPSVGLALAVLAHQGRGGTLRLDSVKAKCDRGSLTEKQLRELALAAWCEVAGISEASPDSLKQRRQAQQAGQQALREELLGELRGGPKGVAAWNARPAAQRRQAGPFEGADLSGADLSGADLQSLAFPGANFSGAKLIRATLDSCDLRGANLEAADLTGVSARFAKCTRCNLRRAVLRGTNLAWASLTSANLCGADLSSVKAHGARLTKATYDEKTRWPAGFRPPREMIWQGQGTAPGVPRPVAVKPVAGLDFGAFMERLPGNVAGDRLAKAFQMLKAERFQLFADVTPEALVGIVRSQSSDSRLYSCRLAADGSFACCTQNLLPCGGLRGAVCKHLLVLIVGLAKAARVEPGTVDAWVRASRAQLPVLDKDVMSETFLRYKGAEAGEIDWRPTETLPEDYYAL
jgi:uncharacterized protein YjbI with pentapeptide repeats